jgi:hypothetical protein
MEDAGTIVGRGRSGPAVVAEKVPHKHLPRLLYRPDDDGRLDARRLVLRDFGLYAGGPIRLEDSTLTGHGRHSGKAVLVNSDSEISRSRIRGWGTGVGVTHGYVRISNARITGNVESGLSLYQSGARVQDSTISGNGEGVDLSAYSGAKIEGSSISGNSEDGGINLHLSGLFLRRSTIANNSDEVGGGLSVASSSSARIENSTFSGNVARGDDRNPSKGGAISAFRDLDVRATTITGNSAESGAAIALNGESTSYYDPQPATVISSIVAANDSTGGGPDCISLNQAEPVPVQPLSGGGNVFGADGCGTAGPSDILTAGPGLGPLADNGGPTMTHALLPGSPAIANGLDLGLKTDQRGEPRDSQPDSGSFEKQ